MRDKTGVNLERIRKLIDNANVSRQVIADTIGCDVSTVTKHYTGDRNIAVDYVIKYAQYFNVSTDYLLGLSDVGTTDKDIKFVCDYTGLSENVIKILNQDNKNNYSSTINLLLEFRTKEQDDELSILDLISQYINITFIEFVKRHHIEELIGTPKFKELEKIMNQAFLDEITTSLKELKINNKVGENSGNHTKEE